eukprot:TRINITY_DN6434_c0_g1_i1.p1 TRINITY_DN6434_c0_g1~~TRINITY_DN6434_c0_g1_i1.p1  ORF type:complete len:207 (+),score=26.56 TRINITY_DN6434_c0_g1_i1:592-1212(+)
MFSVELFLGWNGEMILKYNSENLEKLHTMRIPEEISNSLLNKIYLKTEEDILYELNYYLQIGHHKNKLKIKQDLINKIQRENEFANLVRITCLVQRAFKKWKNRVLNKLSSYVRKNDFAILLQYGLKFDKKYIKVRVLQSKSAPEQIRFISSDMKEPRDLNLLENMKKEDFERYVTDKEKFKKMLRQNFSRLFRVALANKQFLLFG